MKKLFYILPIVFSLFSHNTNGQFSKLDPTTENTVNQAVNQFMASNQIIGATVGLIKNGEIVYLKGYGYQDQQNQIPATEYTMYRTGSMAKAFSIATALQLYEDTLLDILTDVRNYVPEWPVKPQGTITSYRLMAHRSGINHYQSFDTSLTINYENNYYDYDPISAIDIFKTASLLFGPGSRFGYSSYGINLLGAVVERAGGEPFEWQVKKRINMPLDLPYLQPEYAHRRPYPEETKGYHIDANTSALVETGNDIGIKYKLPSGGFICTAIDLLLFTKGLMENKIYKDTTLFSWAANPAHSGANFGLGIMNDQNNSKPYLWHGGGQQRTNSLFMFYPDNNNGVIICSNTFLNGFPIQNLGEQLINIIPSSTISGANFQNIPHFFLQANLISPNNQDTISTPGDTLKWTAVEHAYTYIYEYDTNAAFTTPVTDTTYDLWGYITPQLANKDYYWRVRGLNEYLFDTIVGPWSQIRSFHTPLTLGVNEINKNDWKIYPNPAFDRIYFDTNIKMKVIQLVDVSGRILATFEDTPKFIEVSELKKGIYFLKFNSEAGCVTKKFIKQ